MKQVFIVTAGDYSDYHICAVFETKELAEAYIKAFSDRNYFGIEEYELNSTAPQNGLKAYFVRMTRQGEVESVKAEDGDYGFYGRGEVAQVLKTNGVNKLFVHCFARDEAHAIKIAGEKRREFIISGELTDEPNVD